MVNVTVLSVEEGCGGRRKEGTEEDGGGKWSGIAAGVDGTLYCSPMGASRVLRIDPVARTATTIGDELDSAILRREDRRETDRPHSNREARREAESHRSVQRREAGHRHPNVKTIRKRIRAETQGQARLANRSCLWQKTNLRMKDLLALRSRTARAPSTTATSMTTSRTSKTHRRVPTRASSSCRPQTCLRSTPTSRREARSRRTYCPP